MRGSEAIVMDALKMDRHPSHFSLSQALSFFASFAPMPKLGLLTDFTHHIEHRATQTLVDQWRTALLSFQELVGHLPPATGRGEGGGPRWWTSVWSEEYTERNLTILPFPPLDTAPLPDENTIRRLPYPIPPIHLAWDGMVVPFHRC